MSRSSYMPDKEADQVLWAQNFSLAINATPAAYGLDAEEADAFATIYTAMLASWNTARNEPTRTKGTVAAKNVALQNMKVAARNLVSIIQGTPTVTEQAKVNAGITVRKTKPTPVPAPTERPFIKVAKVDGRTVTLRLQQDSERRSKPAKVAGATIFVGYGADAPQTMADWEYYTATGRTTVEIDFPPSATGDTVWITAFWQNAKDESGPAAFPVSISLPAGGVLPKAQEMKLAA
jgi:hypothetical protein